MWGHKHIEKTPLSVREALACPQTKNCEHRETLKNNNILHVSLQTRRGDEEDHRDRGGRRWGARSPHVSFALHGRLCRRCVNVCVCVCELVIDQCIDRLILSADICVFYVFRQIFIFIFNYFSRHDLQTVKGPMTCYFMYSLI